MTIKDTLLGQPSEKENRLLDDLAEKNKQRDLLLNDPSINDPREAFDTRVHSLVCRKRNTLNRLGDERLGLRLEINDERSRRRNERTFYLLVVLVIYLVAKSAITWQDLLHFVGEMLGLKF